jgi:hypothetical protein
VLADAVHWSLADRAGISVVLTSVAWQVDIGQGSACSSSPKLVVGAYEFVPLRLQYPVGDLLSRLLKNAQSTFVPVCPSARLL